MAKGDMGLTTIASWYSLPDCTPTKLDAGWWAGQTQL